ncbi:MAG: adenine nucleotide alpha hydrolase [Solirubrobacterales bacterium]
MGRAELTAVLRGLADVAVAVSGGVDSMTLAVVAARDPEVRATMFHAVSPAVPPEATLRVKRRAAEEGWDLRIVDAEEFRDRDYLRNPVDRCFYCKSNLYATIAASTDSQIVSGTNADDLGDYRPGLKAAATQGVRHPYVEAGIDKDEVRGLARALGLEDIAELPAAPCLASRIETGLAIEPRSLRIVNEVERDLTRRLEPEAVRCRVRAGRVVVELDEAALGALDETERSRIVDEVAERWRRGARSLPVELSPYRRGSAFLRGATDPASPPSRTGA